MRLNYIVLHVKEFYQVFTYIIYIKIHGCGEEAKKQARAHIRRTGNLNVNETGASTSYSQDIKHKYAEKKLHEKIETMKAQRTGADKKKDKK